MRERHRQVVSRVAEQIPRMTPSSSSWPASVFGRFTWSAPLALVVPSGVAASASGKAGIPEEPPLRVMDQVATSNL